MYGSHFFGVLTPWYIRYIGLGLWDPGNWLGLILLDLDFHFVLNTKDLSVTLTHWMVDWLQDRIVYDALTLSLKISQLQQVFWVLEKQIKPRPPLYHHNIGLFVGYLVLVL